LFPRRLVPWRHAAHTRRAGKKRTIDLKRKRGKKKKKAESRMCARVDARHFFWSKDIDYFHAQSRRSMYVRCTPTTKRSPFTEDTPRQHPKSQHQPQSAISPAHTPLAAILSHKKSIRKHRTAPHCMPGPTKTARLLARWLRRIRTSVAGPRGCRVVFWGGVGRGVVRRRMVHTCNWGEGGNGMGLRRRRE